MTLEERVIFLEMQVKHLEKQVFPEVILPLATVDGGTMQATWT